MFCLWLVLQLYNNRSEVVTWQRSEESKFFWRKRSANRWTVEPLKHAICSLLSGKIVVKWSIFCTEELRASELLLIPLLRTCFKCTFNLREPKVRHTAFLRTLPGENRRGSALYDVAQHTAVCACMGYVLQ